MFVFPSRRRHTRFDCGWSSDGCSSDLETHVVDHTCRQCRRGLYHLCENTRVLGVDRDGSFARYVLLPAENCWRNAPGLSPEVAALQEPFGNAVHAATAGSLKDSAVAIFG